MEQAVGSFFGLQLGRAGKFLDQGWLQVTGVEESEQVERLEGLRWKLEFEKTLLDVKDPVVRGRASVFYDSAVANEGTDGLAKRHEVVLSLWPWSDPRAKDSGSGARAGEPLLRRSVSLVLGEPFELDLGGLAPGDYLIACLREGVATGVSDWICPSVSLVERTEDRFGRMEQWIESVRKEPGHTSRSTAKFLAKELSRGRKGTSFEIDLPWNRLLRDFEQIAAPDSTQESSMTGAFGEWVSKSGWKWMQLSREKSTQVVRMEVPEYDAQDSELKLPLLIALHGAGGSENMFFQTYGAGRLIELGRQRRWIDVSPSQTLAGLGFLRLSHRCGSSAVGERGRLYRLLLLDRTHPRYVAPHVELVEYIPAVGCKLWSYKTADTKDVEGLDIMAVHG
jgi:hypothetical protein